MFYAENGRYMYHGRGGVWGRSEWFTNREWQILFLWWCVLDNSLVQTISYLCKSETDKIIVPKSIDSTEMFVSFGREVDLQMVGLKLAQRPVCTSMELVRIWSKGSVKLQLCVVFCSTVVSLLEAPFPDDVCRTLCKIGPADQSSLPVFRNDRDECNVSFWMQTYVC